MEEAVGTRRLLEDDVVLLGEGGEKRFVSKEDKLDLDRNGVLKVLNKAITKDSFMSRIAKFTARNTFGGLPGFGADNAEYSAIRTLPDKLKVKVRGELLHVPRITTETRFRKLFESADLGSQQFNEFGPHYGAASGPRSHWSIRSIPPSREPRAERTYLLTRIRRTSRASLRL